VFSFLNNLAMGGTLLLRSRELDVRSICKSRQLHYRRIVEAAAASFIPGKFFWPSNSMKNFPLAASISRREFLGGVSASTGLLTLVQAAPGQSSTCRKLGVALCGLGNYARGQLGPALKLTRNCELRGVVTGSPEKGAAWAKEYGFPAKNVYGYDTMAQLSENLDIDIVYIVTPNALHAQHVIAAAGAKKHVICEKPMAVSVAESGAMLSACRANNVKLSIGYRLQFEPHYEELKRHARELDWGVFMRMSGGFSFVMKEPQWRAERKLAGGGPLMDLGIYPIQAACMAAGEAPVAVTASELRKQRPEFFRDIEEAIEWTMEFAGGARGDFSTSYNDNLNKFRAEAAKGWIESNPAYSYSGLHAVTHAGPLILAVPPSQQAVQMDDFARCVRDDLPTRVPGEMGCRDMVIIEAIYASAAQGGKRVEIAV
jgi:glucose-fructose oxidoreductase